MKLLTRTWPFLPTSIPSAGLSLRIPARSTCGLLGKALLLLSLLAPTAVVANDRSGVRPNAVEIPTGAGTISGLGDALTVSPSTGAATYEIPVPLPHGAGGHRPTLNLVYNSGAPSGEVGVSWSLGLPVVRRSLRDGLPELIDGAYDSSGDLTVRGVPGLTELAAVAADLWRPFPEGAFAYAEPFRSAAGIDQGLLVVLRDGTQLLFGTVAEARIVGPNGTFEWHLTEQVDVYGHRTVYAYENSGNYPRLQSIRWNIDSPELTCHVEFEWETRPDEIRSYVSGASAVLDERVSGIRVYRGDELHRTLLLGFADESGLSRLGRVDMVGWDNSTSYPSLTLAYTELTNEGVAVVPVANASSSPVGSVSLTSESAELIDFNGDALPDVLEMSPTAADGFYRLFVNNGTGFDSAELLDPAGVTYLGQSAGGIAQRRATTFIDVDGDALADIVTAASSEPGEEIRFYPVSRTAGGVSAISPTAQVIGGPDLQISPFSARTQLSDLDMDRIPDLIQIDGASREIRVAWGHERWVADRVVSLAPDTNLNLDSDSRFLGDVNGDGLDDIVVYAVDEMYYYPGMGFGQFSPESTDILGVPDLDAIGVPERHFRDVTGDGLPDLVGVGATALYVWPMNGSGAFGDQLAPITALPDRNNTGEIRLVDMNANGTVDILWVDTVNPDPETGSSWVYIDLLPAGSPALLRSVDNALGQVITLDYMGMGSMAQQAAQYPDLTNPQIPNEAIIPQMLLHRRIVEDGLSISQLTEYIYAGGYFDYNRAEFLGFRRVLTLRPETGDGTIDGQYSFGQLNTLEEFFVGATDDPGDHRALAGLLKLSRVWDGTASFDEIEAASGEGLARASGGSTTIQNTWDAYELDVTTRDGRILVRPVQTQQVTTRTELSDTQDQRTTTRTTWSDFDPYGNAQLETQLGNVDDPNDDRRIRRAYINDTSNWRVGFLSEETLENGNGERASSTRTYFDDLPLGQVGQFGAPTRTEAWTVDDDYVVQTQRSYDVHGNVSVELGAEGQRTEYEYDTSGTFIGSVTRITGNDEVPELRWEVEWDAAQGDTLVALTNPDGGVQRLRYDGLGRPVEVFEPDDAEEPSVRHAYYQSSSISRVVTERRTAEGWLAEVTFQNGTGEVLGRARQIDGARWLAESVVELGPLGWPVRNFAAVEFESAATPDRVQLPESLLVATELTHDAYGRTIRTTDAEGRTTTVLPGSRSELMYDGRDNAGTNSDGVAYPTRVWRDGLGRITAVEEARAEGDTFRYSFEWDAADRPLSASDAHGINVDVEWDGRGVPLRLTHPDLGQITWQYDLAGREVLQVDADGNQIETAWDMLDRRVSRTMSGQAGARVERWGYDTGTNGAGRQSSATTPDVSVQSRYDSRGRVIEDVYAYPDGTTLNFSSEYDAAGRLMSREYPNGKRIRFRYDGLDRVIAVDGVVTSVVYGLAAGDQTLSFDNRVSEVRFANGETTTFGRDLSGRMTSLRVGVEDQLVQLVRSIDANGNTVSVSDISSALLRVFGERDAVVMDEVERLTSFAGSRFSQAYDRAGHVTELVVDSEPVSSLTYLTRNGRPTNLPGRIGNVDCVWSDAGRLSQMGETSFRWGADGRVTSLQSSTNDTALGYDHNGRLVSRELEGESVLTPTPDYRRVGQQGWVDWALGGNLVLHIPDVPSVTARGPGVPSGPGTQGSWSTLPVLAVGPGPAQGTIMLLLLAALGLACSGKRKFARTVAMGTTIVCFGLACESDSEQDRIPDAMSSDVHADISGDVAADVTRDTTADTGEVPIPPVAGVGYTVLDWIGSPAATVDERGEIHRWAFAPYGRTIRRPARGVSHVADMVASRGFAWGEYIDEEHVQLGARLYNASWGFFVSVDPRIWVDPAHNTEFPERRETVRYGSANPMSHADTTGLSPDWGMAFDAIGDAVGGFEKLQSLGELGSPQSIVEGFSMASNFVQAAGQIFGGVLSVVGAITGDDAFTQAAGQLSSLVGDVSGALDTVGGFAGELKKGFDYVSSLDANDVEAALDELWNETSATILDDLGVEAILRDEILTYGDALSARSAYESGSALLSRSIDQSLRTGGISFVF